MNLFNFFEKSKPFLPVFKEYFNYISPGKKDGTLEKYHFFYQAVERFLLATNQDKIQLSEIKVRTMEAMRNWLHTEKPRTGEHVSRHIEHCQAAFNYAILMEYAKYNPISAIKNVREKTEDPVSLTNEEIAKMLNHTFTSQSRNLVIDLFLFQCFTGLSYIDIWLYEVEGDTIIFNGEKKEIEFITSKRGRGKNNKPYAVEFNVYARAIHNKYQGKFTYITNQGYNKLLKKVAFNLNINKDLSTHNARKTYATLRYNQGMTFEGLADEMGNTPDVLKKHYITNGRERIKRDIQSMGQTSLIPDLMPRIKDIWTLI